MKKTTTPGPFGCITESGQIGLNAEGQRELAEHFAQYPMPLHLLKYSYPWQTRFLRSKGWTDEELNSIVHTAGVKAMARFDPDLGVKFSTYLVWWLRATVTRQIESMNKGSRYGHGEVSLDDPVGKDGSFGALHGREDPEIEGWDRRERCQAVVQKLLKQLPAWRYRAVLSMYFGEEMTLDQIGSVFEISRERVRQIVAKSLRRIQAYAAEHGMKDAVVEILGPLQEPEKRKRIMAKTGGRRESVA